jgi:iron complex outermembrane recepter protein
MPAARRTSDAVLHTLVNLSASYKLRMAGTEGFFFARLNNLTNELAYNATSIGTVRPLAPLPGRGLIVGLRLSF